MDQGAFIQDMLGPLTGTLVAALVSVVAGILLGVVALTRGRPSAGLGGLVLAPLALAVAGLGWWSGSLADPASVDASRTALAGIIGPGLLGLILAVPAVLLHGILAAVAGSRGTPRAWAVAAVGGVGVLGAVLLPVLGGQLVGDGQHLMLALPRAGGYGVLGLITLAAMLGGDPDEGGGPEAGANAALAFALLIGLGEATGRAAAWFLLLGPFAGLPTPAARIELVEVVSETLMDPYLPWSLGAVGCGLLVAVAGLVGVARHGGRRLALALPGLVWLAVAPLPLLAADPGTTTWSAWARALGEVEAPPVAPEAPSEGDPPGPPETAP